jgi:uncharacterized membrane protein
MAKQTKQQTQRTEAQARGSLVRLCCYIALILAAVLIFIRQVLPLIGLNLTGKLLNWLDLIKDVALLLGIGFGAYSFGRSHGKVAIIAFWIAVLLYVASAICGII